MGDIKYFANLCRVCLRKPEDLDDGSKMIILKQEQIEKLIFIGNSTKVNRTDKQLLCLCTTCELELEKAYDFVIKFNSSTLKIGGKIPLFATEDAYQLNELNSEAVNGTVIVTEAMKNKFFFARLEQPSVSESCLKTSSETTSNAIPEKESNKTTRKATPKAILEKESNKTIRKTALKAIPEKKVPASSKNEEKSTVCDICDKQFLYRTNMLRHVRSVHGTERYHCDFENCGSTFTQKSSLKIHLDVHRGVLKYCCVLCGYKFTQSKSLLLHIRTHTGERPFICDCCSKGFAQKSNLIRHFKALRRPSLRRENSKRFVCDKCSPIKYLSTKQSLLRHSLSRHVERKRFTQLDAAIAWENRFSA